MFVKHHIEISAKGDNLGSCEKYAKYLNKEAQYFFNHFSDKITLNETILLIDTHSKGQLKKDEAKWYAPVYALSEHEAQFICYKLFNRICEDYEELNDAEKLKYNNYVVKLGRKFQDCMAENFNKKDIGIIDGSNLCYVGVVENDRIYKEFDEEVKAGTAQAGQSKKGFNTHIHLIQSRKANNAKKSKISPNSFAKNTFTNNLGQKVGFDRNNFYNKIEQKFDEITGYKRNQTETFEYKKADKFQRKTQVKQRKKYFTKEQIQQLKNSADIQGYFFYLSAAGKLKYSGKDEQNRQIFTDNNSKATYKVSAKFWTKNNEYWQQDLFKAAKILQQNDWLDTINDIDKHKGFAHYTENAVGFTEQEAQEIAVLKQNIGSLFR